MDWFFLFAGAFLGYIATYIYDSYVTHPKLIVDTSENADGEKHRFLHLQVTNYERKGIAKFIRRNRVAEYVKVNLKFIDPVTNSDICEFIGRWSSKAEPIESHGTNDGSFNPAMAIEAEREILLPGETKKLTIAVKHQGDEHFSGFNNWSYTFPKWENPEWVVGDRCVKLQAEVYTDKQKLTKHFVIQNPSKNTSGFRVKK